MSSKTNSADTHLQWRHDREVARLQLNAKKKPAKPVLDAEANYEKVHGWDAFGVRRRAYWSVFAGAFGHTYGAHGVWASFRAGDDVADSSGAEPWDIVHNPIHWPGLGVDSR
jgi:hypothetical protein